MQGDFAEYQLTNWLSSCVCAKNMSCLMLEHLKQKRRLLAVCTTHKRMEDGTQIVMLMEG
jgi:heme exporter protein D